MRRLFLVPAIILLWCSPLFAIPCDVERLSGEPALAHLNQLKLRHGKAFADAMRLLQEKGFKPTNEVTVFRTTPLARSRVAPSTNGIQRTQTTYGDSSGEVTMWSWDD